MNFKNSIIICFLMLLLSACNKDKEDATARQQCDDSNTTFNQLYNNLANSPSNKDKITMDAETHSYTFEVLTDKTICKIGYQSVPELKYTPYLIEIYDNTSNSLVYSISSIFSSTSTSYVSIPSVSLVVGHSYTIKRTQKNWKGNIGNTIGRLVYNTSWKLSFPIILDDLKITGSSFYGGGGPMNDFGIPYIDIVF